MQCRRSGESLHSPAGRAPRLHPSIRRRALGSAPGFDGDGRSIPGGPVRMSAAIAVDPAVRDQLVMTHVDLVKAMASRLRRRLPSQVEVSELVSVGVLGLIDAATRYQPTLGVPFDAFARR